MVPLNFKVPPTQQNRSSLDVAMGYQAAGIPTFPCHEQKTPGTDPSTGEFRIWDEKSPCTVNGLNGATATPRIVKIFFGDKYPNALIGVPTGEPLGAWVLDIDIKEMDDGTVVNGFDWLQEMEASHDPLPLSAAASTPRGGRHYYFKHEPGMRNRASIMPAVDSRADGGYVCAPGSVMADGRSYAWIEYDGSGVPEFPEAPAWLLDMLKAKSVPEYAPTNYTPSEGDNERYVEAAIRGEIDRLVSTRAGRNQAINETAFSLGTLVGAGMLSRAEAEGHIMAAAHANGYIAKDGERAARQTMKSGMDSGIKSPRQIQPRDSANDNTRQVPVEGMIAKTIERQKAKATVQEHTQERISESYTHERISPAPRTRERFEKTWFDEIKEGEPKVFIIKGAFGEREFTTVSGLPGTGKSVIVTDAACHVATGREWHGHKVKQGLVVYVAAERKKLTERRMMAFRKHHGVHDVPLLVIGGRLDFTSSLKDAKDLIAAIKEAEIETGLTCVWVIIDTLTRVFGAGDQNASKDMSRFVQSCDEILAETSAHVTAIHHSAWSGERGKGAIDLDGAVDASFMVKKSAGGKYKLVCDGTNDGEEGDVVNFTMTGIVLGQDEDGEDTTAPVVVTAKPDVVPTSGGANGIAAKVLAALGDAIQEHGVVPDGAAFPEEVIVVNETQWREAYYKASGGKTDTIQKRFKRGLGSLLEGGQARQIGQWFFPQ